MTRIFPVDHVFGFQVERKPILHSGFQQAPGKKLSDDPPAAGQFQSHGLSFGHEELPVRGEGGVGVPYRISALIHPGSGDTSVEIAAEDDGSGFFGLAEDRTAEVFRGVSADAAREPAVIEVLHFAFRLQDPASGEVHGEFIPRDLRHGAARNADLRDPHFAGNDRVPEFHSAVPAEVLTTVFGAQIAGVANTRKHDLIPERRLTAG